MSTRRPLKASDFWFPLALIAVASIVGAVDAQAQTCPAAPADPVPRDAVRLAWTAPTTWVEGGAIVGPITYSLYELVGTTRTLRCTTTATSAGQTGLSVGAHTWAVTAKTPASTPANVESVASNTASKTVDAPPLTPNAPTSFTVSGSFTLTVTPNP